jgi:hypothetical protein
MRARGVLPVLILLPLLSAAEAKEPPEGWKEFQPKDKSFSVWLPDKGARRTERQRSIPLQGQSIKINVVQVQVKGSPTYSAVTLVLPSALARKIPQEDRLEILSDAFLAEVKGKVTDETTIKQGRAAGKDYQIKTAKGRARLRVFALGGHLYQAAVAGNKEQVESKEADAFLELYKLAAAATGKRKGQ